MNKQTLINTLALEYLCFSAMLKLNDAFNMASRILDRDGQRLLADIFFGRTDSKVMEQAKEENAKEIVTKMREYIPLFMQHYQGIFTQQDIIDMIDLFERSYLGAN